MEFKSEEELKNRVMPALNMKKEMLAQEGIYISTNEIWHYLKINKWMNSKNLTLNEIVNDILKSSFSNKR